jgi:hypothetical protein
MPLWIRRHKVLSAFLGSCIVAALVIMAVMMVDWFANEGTPHDLNNPLNLQTPYGGSTTSNTIPAAYNQ